MGGNVKILIVLGLLLTSISCSSSNPTTVTVPQSPDLAMARALLTAQTAIEQSKTLITTYPTFKDALNKVIASYNTAEAAYLVYHQAVTAGNNPDMTQVQAQINQVVQDAASLVAQLK